MSIGNEPAYPDGTTNLWGNANHGGLTKRELFAKAAMAAFIANGDNTMFLQAPTYRPLTESVAEAACDYADALLAQLSKAPQP